jgi:hypothetical protein
VNGDGAANSIAISRDAAGSILVNNGAIAVTGGRADGRQHESDHRVRSRRSSPAVTAATCFSATPSPRRPTATDISWFARYGPPLAGLRDLG